MRGSKNHGHTCLCTRTELVNDAFAAAAAAAAAKASLVVHSYKVIDIEPTQPNDHTILLF
jgi:hypothetical protein